MLNNKLGLIFVKQKNIPSFLLKNNAIVFVTLKQKDKAINCLAANGKNILQSCLSAAKQILKDYDLSLLKKMHNKIYWEICILFNEHELQVKMFSKKFVKGLHSVSVFFDGKSAFFKNSVSIDLGLENEGLLEKLYEKLSCDKKLDITSSESVFIYDTIEFREDFSEKRRVRGLFDLYRYSPILLQSEITIRKINESLRYAQNALAKLITKNSQVIYQINISKDEKIFDNSRSAKIRKMAGIWTLASSIKRNSIDVDLDKVIQAKNMLLNDIDLDDLSMLSFAIFSESEFDISENYNLLEKKIFNFMDNKLIHKKFNKDDLSFVVGLNALVSCYEINACQKKIELTESLFSLFTKGLLKNEKTFYLIPWLSWCAARLYYITGDLKYAQYVVEINKKMMGCQVSTESHLIDIIGSIDLNNSTRATAGFIEGLTQAYKIANAIGDAKSQEIFLNGIFMALRALLQNQFDSSWCFSSLAIGGFRNSSVDNNIRIDNIQHAIIALMSSLDVFDLMSR